MSSERTECIEWSGGKWRTGEDSNPRPPDS